MDPIKRELVVQFTPESTMTTGNNGDKYWKDQEDILHREDGPALEYADGSNEWFVHGERHREDGPAFEYADGFKEWYLHNKRHREDGPAVENSDGSNEWWAYGERHREDGPAVINADGSIEFWLNGEQIIVEDMETEYLDKVVFPLVNLDEDELVF